ncbi:type I polyketide synthase [Dyella silvatica]|uniref:type I polyketide synthase n=1 Tax=Dyella silvatica TaxID=2992128 RepID=UPI002257E31F|nr:type I polyketide synthase [Dyella silvatica]
MAHELSAGNLPIAVIGMAAVLPKARNLRDYWTHILNGSECIEPVPGSRWRLDQYYDPNPAAADKTYSDRGGFIPDIAFDPLLFGIPPKNFPATDSAQLYALAVARQALLDAGYAAESSSPGRRPPSGRSGVVLGISGTTINLAYEMARRSEIPKWRDALRQAGVDEAAISAVANAMGEYYPQWTEDTFPGFLANIVAGRIANRFGLGGASHVVDAACASSLAAVRLACQELRSGAADLMISGGIDTDNSQVTFLSFSKTPALSKSGKVRAFDNEADGTLISEGVAMLVLKRLADAQADGDRIYGVIRGTGASTDAAGGAIYAPRSEGQVRALRSAYADAGFAPNSIGLVEAHATGTAVGDAVEIESLQQVLEGAAVPVALGSVKSQIGHTKAAAGAASLIKTMLALHHKILPPTANVQQPTARFSEHGPLYLPRQARPWQTHAGVPRRAGVSAFGFGGANVHLALEEYIAGNEPAMPLSTGHRGVLPILLSAATPAALAQQCRELAAQWTQNPDHSQPWPDTPPAREHPRLGLIATDVAAAITLLHKAADALTQRSADAEWTLDHAVHYRQRAIDDDAQVVAVFSGQGAQTVGMGARLVIDFPVLRSIFDAFDHEAAARGLSPISSLLYPPEAMTPAQAQAQRQALTPTLYAQTSIGAYNMAVYTLLRDSGLQPALALGHSFGELSALWAAGSLDDAAYRKAVFARGIAMTPPADLAPGGLLALNADEQQTRALLPQLPGLSLANLNSPRQTVVGGTAEALEHALPILKQANIGTVRIPVAAAFHTAHIDYANAPWRDALSTIEVQAPQLPVLANLSAQAYPASADAVRELLQRQPFNPVRFREQIEAAHAAGGRIFVEIGPRAILTRLVGEILADQAHVALAVAADPAADDSRQIQQAMLQLAVLGLPLRLRVPPQDQVESSALTMMVSAPHAKFTNRAEWPHVDYVPPATAAAVAPVPTSPPVAAAPAASERVWHAQQALAETHRHFLDGQLELARTLAQHAPSAEVLAQIERGQAQAMALHLSFLQGQQTLLSECAIPTPTRPPIGVTAPTPISVPLIASEVMTRAAAEAVVVAPAIPAAAMAPAATHASSDIRALLLRIVADKTGFPLEMLTPDMRLEADLGVDSIKRVEILAGVRDALGIADQGNAGDELRNAATISDIASLLARHVPAGAPLTHSAAVTPMPAVSAPVSASPIHASPVASATLVDIGALLLRIVAEKTGFPADMLTPDMRLEADLGVDSIKRVEILAGLRDALGIADSGMAGDELRHAATMREIAALLRAHSHAVAAPSVSSSTTQAEAGSTTLADIGTLLLRIVAEKTGFPADMLTPDMRLESDLGVDSIKRVEILAGVREALGITDRDGASDELRNAATLAEIAALLGRYTAAPSTAASATDDHAVPVAPTHEDHRPLAVCAVPIAAPLPPRAQTDISSGNVWLIADGSALTAATAATLRRHGYRPLVLALAGWTAVEQPDGDVRADDLGTDGLGTDDIGTHPIHTDIEHLNERLSAIAADYGQPQSVLLLQPETAATPSRQRLALALRLVQMLLPWQPRSILGMARMDGRLGVDGGGDSVGGGLAGLLKTLRHEHPEIAARFVDLAPQLGASAAAEHLLQELHDCNKAAADGSAIPSLLAYPAECGWNAQGRWTLACTEAPPQHAGSLAPMQAGELVLVTGGARGITARCIEALAAAVPAHFVLLGRTTLDDAEPAWAQGIEDHAVLKAQALRHLRESGAQPTPRMLDDACRAVLAAREVRSNLQALRAHGAKVSYHAVDLGDADATRQTIHALITAHGPVKTLIHGAGALADRRIADKTSHDIETVLRPKLDALLTLIEVLREQPPSRVLLFSSTAGYSGNEGQSDYAMANEALSKLAYRLARGWPGSRIVSLAWGPWEGGMVNDALKKLFADRGIRLLPVAVGTAIFTAAALSCHAGGYQFVVGATLPLAGAGASSAGRLHIQRTFSPQSDALIDQHRIAGHAVLPSTWIAAWMVDTAARWLGRRIATLEAYRIFKGVVFDSPAPCTLTLQLTVENDAVVQASVVDAQGRPRFAGTLRLDQVLAERQREWPSVDTSVCDPAAYLSGPIQYGPGFRGVESVLSLDSQGALIECRIPEHVADSGSGDGIGALTFDIASHACLIWLMQCHQAACLPASMGRLCMRGDAPMPRHFFVAMQLRVFDGVRFGCDFELCSSDGKVFATYDDFAATVVDADSALWTKAMRTGNPASEEIA